MAALFFDVDGTLVDSYHGIRGITPSVRAELSRVQGLGHKIFLSSGRPRLLLTPDILDVDWDGLVLANGGYVEMDGQSVYEERMGADLAGSLASYLESMGEPYLIACARQIYTLRTNTAIRAFFEEAHPGIFDLDFDLSEVLSRAIKMETLIPREERPRVTRQVWEDFGGLISCDGHGGEGTFELYPTAISKAKGVEVVLQRLGLTKADAYAFGDGTNDLEMIRACGCGVAMGNAEDEVKAEANIVCAPVWEDGVAQMLCELF